MKFIVTYNQHGIDITASCEHELYNAGHSLPVNLSGAAPEAGLYEKLLPLLKQVEQAVLDHEKTNDHKRRKL